MAPLSSLIILILIKKSTLIEGDCPSGIQYPFSLNWKAIWYESLAAVFAHERLVIGLLNDAVYLNFPWYLDKVTKSA